MAEEDGVYFDSTRAVLQFALRVREPVMPRPFMNKAMAAQVPKKVSKKTLLARKRAALAATMGLVPRKLVEDDPLEGTRKGSNGAPRLPTGLDEAHLAGLILAAFKTLEPSYQALLTAAVAQPRFVCICGRDCCSGWKPNKTWQGAVQAIMVVLQTTGEVLRKPSGKAKGTRGLGTHPRLRQVLVESYFTGRPPPVLEMAAMSEVTKETVARHRDWIWTYMEQEEAMAWKAADELFDTIGVVGCHDQIKE
jgi:hypothetical protein